MTEQPSICPCGCGRLRKRNRKYANPDTCRRRVYESRRKAAATAAGLPAVVSLKAAEAASTTNGRPKDSERARNRAPRVQRTGLSVYLPDLAAADAARIYLAAARRPGLGLVADAIAKAQERRRRRDAKAGRDVPVAVRPGGTSGRASGGVVEGPSASGGDVTTAPSTRVEV